MNTFPIRKPASLNAGEHIHLIPPFEGAHTDVLTVLRRDARARSTLVQCAAWVGQQGPDDTGKAWVGDYQMKHWYTRAAEGQGARP
jgi:hypothetical protein